MTGLFALSLLAVAAALLRGGSLVGWAQVRVYWPYVAFVSLGLQLVLHNPPVDRQPWALAWGPLLWVGCVAGLLAFLVRNVVANDALRGPWLVAAVGVGLNLLVVVANGGFMPQSEDARVAVRGAAIEAAEPKLRNVVPITDETRLAALGDLIPEPAWLPNANVISIGDLALGSGLAWWAFVMTRRRRVA
jgi:hypothetical protein